MTATHSAQVNIVKVISIKVGHVIKTHVQLPLLLLRPRAQPSGQIGQDGLNAQKLAEKGFEQETENVAWDQQGPTTVLVKRLRTGSDFFKIGWQSSGF